MKSTQLMLAAFLLLKLTYARILTDEQFWKGLENSNQGRCSDAEIITRAEWEARPPTGTTPLGRVGMVFIHHTLTDVCNSQSTCSATMRSMQNYHMDSNGWSDIGYNMVVGTDTRTYEGRGFDTMGAHTGGHNADSIGIAVIGDFTSIVPSETIQQKIRDTIDCAIQEGQLDSNYELFGHRDGVCTSCPGDRFYAEIQTWPEYSHRDLPGAC